MCRGSGSATSSRSRRIRPHPSTGTRRKVALLLDLAQHAGADLREHLGADGGDTRLVEEIYLATLCRLPTAVEKTDCVKAIIEKETKLEGAQDLLWALLNSNAFLFNR